MDVQEQQYLVKRCQNIQKLNISMKEETCNKHYPEFNIWESKTNNPKLIIKKCDVSEKKELKFKKNVF